MRRRLIAILAALMSSAAGVRAQEGGERVFSFDGFGTLGLAHSSEGRADYVALPFVRRGVGASGQWSAELDSRIGAQVTATLSPRLSAVLQLVSEQRWDGSWRPTVEWANVTFSPSADLDLRAGRIATPSLLRFAARKVGYGLPWVRPPDVYQVLPVTGSDGVDLTFRSRHGPVKNGLTALYGRRDVKLPDGGRVEARNVWGLYEAAEAGPVVFRLAYQQARVDLGAVRDDSVEFVSAGGAYEPGTWFLMAEWAALSGFSDRTSAWYLSAGRPFGDWTPYATYGRLSRRGPSGPASGGGAPAAPAVPPGGQATVSLGVRWDFAPNLDLKLQYDRVRLEAGTAGRLINVEPGFRPGGRLNLVSLALDFVF